MDKDEALKRAIKEMQALMQHIKDREPNMLFPDEEYLIYVCKEALKHQEQPLEIEILNNLYDMAEERDGDAFDFDHIKFARSIEQAHGIGAINET